MTAAPPVEYADARDVGQLAEPLRSRVAQAIADAPTGGLILVSGKRTDYQQWVLRHERCPGREYDRACKGHPTTAIPGTSHHRNTDATHCAADMGGRDMPWFRAHLEDYGLYLAVPGENWHVEPKGTPRAPIKPYGTHTDPNKGRQWEMIRPGDDDAKVYQRGGFDNEVTEVQIRLTAIAKQLAHREFLPNGVDGDYGPKSQGAVRAFKRWIQAIQKATHQPVWPNDDASIGSKTIEALRFWTP